MQPVNTAPRALSPVEAAGEAVDLVKRRLFPFRFDRWLALGFVAFLDHCGRGHAGGTTRLPSGGETGLPGSTSGGGVEEGVGQAADWIAAHVVLIAIAALAALALILALAALATFLHSRGVFMYLDDVATGRADVVRPWREHRDKAHSYFVWRFGLTLATLIGVLALLVPGLLCGWSLVRHGVSAGPIAGIVVIVLLFFLLLLFAGLFGVLLRDVAAPLQMVLGVPCGEATRAAWALVRSHAGTFVLYALLKIVFGVVAVVVTVLAGCATCCIGFLPVLGETLLQPLYYFERAWSLFLLRQAGYDLFTTATAAALPPPLPPGDRGFTGAPG